MHPAAETSNYGPEMSRFQAPALLPSPTGFFPRHTSAEATGQEIRIQKAASYVSTQLMLYSARQKFLISLTKCTGGKTHCNRVRPVLVFSYLASMSGVVCVVCPFADDEKLKNIHVDLALLV